MKPHKLFFLYLLAFNINQLTFSADDGSDLQQKERALAELSSLRLPLPTDLEPKIAGRMLYDTKRELFDALLVQTVGEHKGSVCSVACNVEGTRIVSGGDDGKVKLWDLTDNGVVGQTVGEHEGSVLSVACNGEGTRIVSGGSDGKVRLCHLPISYEKHVSTMSIAQAAWISWQYKQIQLIAEGKKTEKPEYNLSRYNAEIGATVNPLIIARLIALKCKLEAGRERK